MRKNKIFQCIIASILSLVILFSFLVTPTAEAAGVTEITFENVEGKAGQEVLVPVTIKNNPGIATFRFRVTYDDSVLTFMDVKAGSILEMGNIVSTTDSENHTVTFLWYSTDGDIAVDGEIAVLRFAISSEAASTYPLKVTCDKTDIVNSAYQNIDFAVHDGSISVGHLVSGNITSFGDSSEPVTLKLLSGTTEVATVISTDSTYQFKSIPSGTYSLTVAKKNHVTRKYEVNVTDEDFAQDVKIHLIGDINGDGRVRSVDYARILAHVRGTTMLGEYEFRCADVNGDDRVRTVDYARVLAHVRGTNLLW